MQQIIAPVVKDLALIGGGHSHVAVLKKFGMDPLPGVRLTLICREAHTPYSGMLPGFVAGHYNFDEAHIDLGPLAQFAGARFYNEEAIGLDTYNKLIFCRNRPPIPYDVVSINIGSCPVVAQTPGAEGVVIPVKPINRFISHWMCLIERLLARAGRTRIGVVGGGAGGVELVLSMQHGLNRIFVEQGRATNGLEFHLITEEPDILTAHGRLVAAKFRRILADRGVQLHTEFRVDKLQEGRIVSSSDASRSLDEILWVTGAGAAQWVRDAGLDVDKDGFMRVDDTLRSTSHSDIFGAGDIATMVNFPRPKSGVLAVRQGRPLGGNLHRALLGKPLRPFAPQRRFLSLISTGDKNAVASRAGWSVEGAWVWRWKDWIDRRFMRKYNDLPEMYSKETIEIPQGLADQDAIKEISGFGMRCGGCGAKVGAKVLRQTLSRLEIVTRDDVLIGLSEPDDGAVVSVPHDKVIVHTVDSFRAMIDDPYIFGKIAANHCLGDIFAMGGDPQSALVVATVPLGLEDKIEDTLTQMMTGVIEVLREANTALVGGHTSEGVELSMGLAVNGLVEPRQILRKSGMRPGDRLILTKALGTGTLLAANMRAKAKARWIKMALASMLQSNRDSARCLASFGSTSCTDVTGFGFLGHLVEMIEASSVTVDLDLHAIPFLDGARETAASGFLSSLQPQNTRFCRAIANLQEVCNEACFPLLLDPQTAGGLLASIPGDVAEDCLAGLRSTGYSRSAIVGRVKPRNSQAESITVLC